MTLFEYIDTYGVHSFTEEPLNQVDCVIFSFLSYVHFDSILEHPISIRDAGRMYLGIHPKKEKKIIAVRDADKLFLYLKDSVRFCDCILSHYQYESSHDTQFGVLSIEYQKNCVYVSFEGTDEKIRGWIDDLTISYSFPTISHKKAIQYLNRYYTFSPKKLIIGGHSRGGNLALVASMKCNFLVQKKILDIYNVDGPGLLKKEFESRDFLKIHPKYHHVLPRDSIVGTILYSDSYETVKTSISGPLSHDILYWEVSSTSFCKSSFSSFSKAFHEGLIPFIEKYSKEELHDFTQNLDFVCQKAKIDSLLDFRENPHAIIRFMKETKEISPHSREMILALLNVLLRAFGNSKYQDIVQFMKRFESDLL